MSFDIHDLTDSLNRIRRLMTIQVLIGIILIAMCGTFFSRAEDELQKLEVEKAQAYNRLWKKMNSDPDHSPEHVGQLAQETVGQVQNKFNDLEQRRAAEDQRRIQAASGPSHAATGTPDKASASSSSATGSDRAPSADEHAPLRPEYILDGKDIPKEITFPDPSARKSPK